MSRKERGSIFVVGTGRCGSTLLNSLLAMHPDLAWLSSWASRAPNAAFVSIVNRIWNWPALDPLRTKRFLPTPTEPYRTLASHLPSLRTEQQSPEMLQSGRDVLLPYLQKLKRFHGKPRFLAKMVGRPVNAAFFARLLVDARFVHVTRSLKPTLASVRRVAFYRQWEAFEHWPWDPIPPEMLEFHRSHGSPEELALAIRLKLNVEAVRRQLADVERSRSIELPYAELVKNPEREIRRVGEFLGLRIDASYITRVRRFPIYAGADDKWKRDLTPAQIERVDEFERRFGY